MNRLNNIVRRIGGGGAFIASIFLLAMAVLIVSNIIYRFFGGAILATYELVELFAGIAAALALGYTTLVKRHVIITILLSRFSQRTQTILGIFTGIIGLGFWIIVTMGSIDVLSKKGIFEVTLNNGIPLFPFRTLWVIALLFFCLILFTDLINWIHGLVKK
jgi:TRAP-type C4-dicarboxylate transport system permease small subunit